MYVSLRPLSRLFHYFKFTASEVESLEASELTQLVPIFQYFKWFPIFYSIYWRMLDSIKIYRNVEIKKLTLSW